MAQRNRHAGPGTWHHVYNRGIGKRILFASRADYRFFKALMACAVRRGDIETHVFSLLGTHFHLLVRVPPGGDLSKAMGRIQNAYARWFNRRNRRDGPLYRGRFRSKPVNSTTYWITLWRYIEHNPVSAGVCNHPAAYEHGSARYYATGRHPRWLTTSRAHAIATGRHEFPSLAAGFEALVGTPLSDEERQIVEARRDGTADEDPTDDLLAMSPVGFQRWAAEKARNADGLRPSLPMAAKGSIKRALEVHAADLASCEVRISRKSLDASRLLEAALLHELAGMRCEQVAQAMGVSNGTISRWIRMHRRCMHEGDSYARTVAAVARLAIRSTYRRR